MKPYINYNFLSSLDYKNCKDWVIRFLEMELRNSEKHDDPESCSENIRNMIEKVRLVKKDAEAEWNNIWKQVCMLNEDTYYYQRQPEPIYWGIWRIDTGQKFHHGYTEGYLYSAEVLPGGSQKVHKYNRVPPVVKWKLSKVIQKGMTFYTACAIVNEIEQVSSVPSLPLTMTPEEAGKRVLDASRAPDEWQRRPSSKRIGSIKEFVESSDNIIANSPILFIKDSSMVDISNDMMTIDFSKFLIRRSFVEKGEQLMLWTDHKPKQEHIENIDSEEGMFDLRPVWLIDGQHRVRGLSRSEKGGRLSIPIIIFPAEFGLSNAAKIFAEINTLQESLKPLHKLFMQHRFKIVSPISNRNFEPWIDNPNEKRDSRANHLSYELIAKLASREDSALFNKVRILDQNEDDYYVKADQWVNFSRSWFLSGPYESFMAWPESREEEIYEEVNNYFKAFIETVNHDGWKDGRDRWSNSSKKKSLLQSSTHFKALIDLYGEVHHRIRKSGSIINIKEFKTILAPFKWVDWLDNDLKKMFGGGGEKGRTSLFIWMYDALKCKQSHPLGTVMSKTIKSEPGKGILAPPMKSDISVKGTWPTKSKSVYFKSERPFNARRKPTWQLMDEKGETHNNLVIKSNEECELPYDKKMDKIKHFKIQVIWSNASSSNATTTIKIINS